MPFLKVRNLNKSYPSGRTQLHVLRDLSLDVEKGDLIAVLGASGSGKSTLLHMIGGMECPDSGSIQYGDLELVSLAREELARFRNSRVGFIFQFHHLLPEFSALENVMFPLLIGRQPAARCRSLAMELLAAVGLSERQSHKPGELSGGEQQRVAIARALVGSPDIVLADEPTGNLDAHTAESVHLLLQQLHQQRQFTAIVVTHNPALAEICRARKYMRDGQLVDP
ncbi:MAG TPA: ABC transporter ATP-binding protein [Acidobacteriota bacterium]|jgi:lipoprotein-releasing system ATP-binding protein